MKICFILVPIGLVAAWSCDLAYKTLLIQYTCVVYWRIPHKVVPPDVSVCIGFLLKQRSINTPKYPIFFLLLFARSSVCVLRNLLFFFFFYLVCALHLLFSIVMSISVELEVGDCVKLSSVYFAASSLGSMVQRMKVLLMVRWIRYNNFQVLPLRLRPKKYLKYITCSR